MYYIFSHGHMLQLWCNKADVIFSTLLTGIEDTQVYYECKLCCLYSAADLWLYWSEWEQATKIIYLQS